MKHSKFNVICDNTLKKGIIVYNTLTGGVIALDETRIFLSVS